jgi:single-strand DNA-binding protein
MAASVNKVILIGNLGAKPELKYLPSGQAVCELRLATNESFTDKNQQKQERTEWHRVVVWGKQGENCAQYLDKGRSVYIEGRLQTRSWDDKNTGEKRYMTEIVAQSVQFLGGPGGGGGGGGRGRRGRGGGHGGPGGGRGGNPNHGGPRHMQGGGGPRPQHHGGGNGGNGGNGNFGGGNGGSQQPHGEHGGGHAEHASAPATPPSSSHDPDSSGNA